MSEMKDIIDAWGKEVVVNMKAKIDAETIGQARILNKFNPKLIEAVKRIRWRLELPGYAEWVDTGRPPGKMPPKDKIDDWILDRQIKSSDFTDEQLSFMIRRLISIRGTKGKDFFQIFDNSINDLQKSIYSSVEAEVDLEMSKLAKKYT